MIYTRARTGASAKIRSLRLIFIASSPSPIRLTDRPRRIDRATEDFTDYGRKNKIKKIVLENRYKTIGIVMIPSVGGTVVVAYEN